MPEAVAANNVLTNPPASGTVQDSGIQQVENAVTQSNSTPNTQAADNTAPAGDNAAQTDAANAATDADSGKKTPWFQRRIDQLTAEKWDERREKENLRKQTESLLAQLAEVRKTGVVSNPNPATAAPAVNAAPVIDPATGQPAPAAQQPPAAAPTARAPVQVPITETEINAMAERRAQEIARTTAFNKACNDVYSNGKDDFSDFDQSLKTFQMLGGIPPQFLEIVTEMPNAHKVLYKVGKDLDLAERIVKMTPTRMAMELARVEAAVAKPAEAIVSKTTPPIKPIDGASRSEDDPDTMSTEDWIVWREKQLATRRK